MSLMPRDNTPDRLRDAQAARAVQTAEAAAAEQDPQVEPAVPALLRARIGGPALLVLAGAGLAAIVDVGTTGSAAGLLAALVVAVAQLVRAAHTYLGAGPPPLPAATTATGAAGRGASTTRRRARAALRGVALGAPLLAALAVPLVLIDGWHWTRLAVIPLGGVVGDAGELLLAALWERRHPDQQLVLLGDPDEGDRLLRRRPRPGYKPPRKPISVAGLPPA